MKKQKHLGKKQKNVKNHGLAGRQIIQAMVLDILVFWFFAAAGFLLAARCCFSLLSAAACWALFASANLCTFLRAALQGLPMVWYLGRHRGVSGLAHFPAWCHLLRWMEVS